MGGVQGFIHSFSRAMRDFFIGLGADEGGQATTEYILILSTSVAAATALAKVILSTLDHGILRLGAQLELDLKTGRAPVNVWQN